MRVSSNAPALSRRSMMRGLAVALAGASVPVAAIAGNTARQLTAGDAELLAQCRQWKARQRVIRKGEKELSRLAKEAEAREAQQPPLPPELFEKINIRGNLWASPYTFPDERAPWTKARLLNMLNRRGAYQNGQPVSVAFVPTDECRAHAQRLIAIIDERDAAYKRNWAAHNRLEKAWSRLCSEQWRSLKRILRTKAATLQGIAAQAEIVDLDGAIGGASWSPEIDHSIVRVLRNLRTLVAAQAA